MKQSTPPVSDFIRDLISRDLENEKYSEVVTRFPPEPNGYLHIGHAKSICLNFGLALDYEGSCHLRFDDTNPTTEDPEYVQSIQDDIRWLGFDWGEHLYFASDYFEQFYDFAVGLIERGKAYVDSLDGDQIREYRGSISEPGKPSPYRERSVEENLDLFRRMRAGEFDDGTQVLRAKIDMSASNMLMRDPLLYRIRKTHHYRQGNAWCIFPMYDFAHCLEDAIENVTHSLCTLEFENNRELYDWVIDQVGFTPPRPEQTEFARLNLTYTVTSKRKLLKLVTDKHVDGWDDPRMPTLSGLRRRGYTPESIRAFCQRIGVARNFNFIDVSQLEFSIRDDLNHKAPRVQCVLNPLKVVIENYPEDQTEELEAPFWPHDVPKEGSRIVPFSRQLYIERDDFAEQPADGWFRLAPGAEVRLRYAYIIRCTHVIKNDAGDIVELRCTYDPNTRGSDAADGRKVRGTLHWVSAEHSVGVEVRLYDRLFTVERPDSEDDFLQVLNPDSLTVLASARAEPAVAEATAGDHFQFERQGYFFVDSDSTSEGLVFNRTVTLRDTWAKLAGEAQALERSRQAAEKAAQRAAHKERQRQASQDAETPLDEQQQLAFDRYASQGLSDQDASLLARDAQLAGFFDAAVDVTVAEQPGKPSSIAPWVTNELARELKSRQLEDLPFGPKAIVELAALVDSERLTPTAAKEVFALLLSHGGKPTEIMDAQGLERISDVDAVTTAITQVLADHPQELAAYRDGKKALLGFFMGAAMRATGGKADAATVRQELQKLLDS